ncbi:HPr family phosphocarrier protein [Lysinibacillus sp. 54212]|uniref:HPr family phosphocarrier protein n=1 Tax=Lysinibacillus sp. 54212 TaxID=3119829 RepID=UPI002FC9B190
MEQTFKITTPEGLHARPITLLVSAVTPFAAEVQLTFKDRSVNMKSIMGVMSQGVPQGGVITVAAQGTDAEQLIQAVTEVMESKGIGERC